MIIRITTIPTWLPSESSSLGWVFSTKRGEPFTASAFGPFLASRENFHQVLERQGSGERGQHSLGPPLVELTKDSTVQARRSWRASLLTQVPWLGAIIGGICRITPGSPSQRTKTKRAPVEPLARADTEGDQAGRPRRGGLGIRDGHHRGRPQDVCTGRKSLIMSALRETHSTSVAAFSWKRGP